MGVTIKQIASIAGVSRGTVDRVLNNRGRVNPDIDIRVKEIANRMNYRPNRAAKALAANKKPIHIGLVVPAEGNQFFHDVIRGTQKQQKDLADFGVSVEVHTVKGFDVEKQLAMMDGFLKKCIHGLILTPIDDPRIGRKIDEMSEQGIPVVTTNSDINHSKRLAYVGSDYYKGGITAGALMKYLTNGSDKIAIVTGSLKMLGHRQRVEGFLDKIKSEKNGIQVVATKECNDDIFIAYDETKEILQQHPDLKAIYIGAGGTEGVCKAVKQMKREDEVRIVCFDLTPPIRSYMEEGMIDFAILQEPEYQGRKPVELLFEYLINDVKPTKEFYYTKTEICIKESM